MRLADYFLSIHTLPDAPSSASLQFWSAVSSRLGALRSTLKAFLSPSKWRLPMLSGSPLIWLCVVLGLALPAGYGTMKVLEARRVPLAYAHGFSAGEDGGT